MMEDLRNQVAEKTEVQSGSVLLTYFQGDISSMVDEHFTRALSKATKPKGERSKNKRNQKSAHTNDSDQWESHSQTVFQSMFSPERLQRGTSSNPQSSPHGSLNHLPNNALIWPGGSRQDTGLVLPPMVHPSAVSTEGLKVAEHKYTNSLLNLLHNDQPDIGSVMVAPSKQELISGWTKYPGFSNQMNTDISFDSGVQVIEKKNIYWY
ncbi:transcription cofactor vestigial-like protein 1 [Triplophysa rosa]|uniref:Transcription cofactor vestigial-like protein 1 n=1 Tax=Triplophysa rosa TaxID=992332 RepID=A0A9W7WK63_TRIRA|nr:transcription cofactor vestigial-like protein 1 [Triplophysa rosa]XP_057205063.1 transcription cofactor vestigial-like protein 1 [Triplophysa rosa]KAI7801945.1 putative transcription cofactor vestigial-like protein 1 [Triplophysa rosa]